MAESWHDWIDKPSSRSSTCVNVHVLVRDDWLISSIRPCPQAQEPFRSPSCWPLRAFQFALPIGRASSDRTYPGGLPCFDRTCSHSPPAVLTTLIRVPLPICERTREADDGCSYTEVG